MSNNKTLHDPKFHIAKRAALPWYKAWLIRIVAILASLIVCGIVTLTVTGLNPLGVYITMFEASFYTDFRIWNLVHDASILLCISLAVTPAFKMRFWNIGAEGQVLIGGLAAAACSIYFGEKLSPSLLLVVICIISIISGAVWALIPAIFKAKWNTNETLFTLMMNYIAIQLAAFCTMEWSIPKGTETARELTHGQLPIIGENDYLLNILIVAALTIFMFVYLKYSKHGYEISVVGESENTARYIGLNVKKVIIRTMALSGAICGISGLILVSGVNHSVTSGTVDGRGFTAIMVSWLAKFSPPVMILTSLLIIFLERGAVEIASVYSLNDSFADIITGIIIFFIIGCEFFINYQIKINAKTKEVKQ